MSTVMIDGIEVKVSDIIKETLQTLLEYTDVLSGLSAQTGDLLDDPLFAINFDKLIEGIETFNEGIQNVKRATRSGLLQPVCILEAELLSILKDLLLCQETKNLNYLRELLQAHLPEHLEHWHEEGLPALAGQLESQD